MNYLNEWNKGADLIVSGKPSVGRLIQKRAENQLALQQYPAFAYIMKIDVKGGRTWTKIGMTTNTPFERARGIRSKGVKGYKYDAVTVKWFIPCKSKNDAERMEDCLRAVLTLIDPRNFMPHDRLNGYHDDFVTYMTTHPDVRRNAKEFGVPEWVEQHFTNLF